MQKNEVNNSREYLLRCFARELLRMPLWKRRAILASREKKSGEEVNADLKKYLAEESKILTENKIKARKEIKECLKQKHQ